MSRLFLGIDASTQSLTGVVIDAEAGRVVAAQSLRFGEDLPQWGAPQGFLPHADPQVVHAPPLLWVEALDLLLARLQAAGAPLGQVIAVAGSGQQHGSVYLNASAPAALAALDPDRPLADQLRGVFARATSPIWMDSSTHAECVAIEAALGGAEALADITGSAAFERFTGPQIRAFAQREPAAYAQTAHIALVSSFMCSILAGRIAPIDHGDGAGMNLLDLRRRDWHPGCLAATAPGLAGRLPPAVAPNTLVGPISAYFVRKYGFRADAQVAAFSGDNPCSLAGLGLAASGDVAISLGTSDTYFGLMPDFHAPPRGEGHVFVAPSGDYMTLICFKNGSLAREKVRDRYGLDWNGFNAALGRTPPGNRGRLMLPYFDPEIVPRVLQPGVKRSGLDEADADGNCRAVVEAQMISMRLHSRWMGVRPARILATGGASRNPAILQIMADVNQCPVHPSSVANTAALGAALRAANACGTPWPALQPLCGIGPAIPPRPDTAAAYDQLAEKYEAFERQAAD